MLYLGTPELQSMISPETEAQALRILGKSGPDMMAQGQPGQPGLPQGKPPASAQPQAKAQPQQTPQPTFNQASNGDPNLSQALENQYYGSQAQTQIPRFLGTIG